MQVDLTTSNLGEFDRTLTTLGLAAGGKTGVQAIPVALRGQAAFQGTITRSILVPDVKGHLSADGLRCYLQLSSRGRRTIAREAVRECQPKPASGYNTRSTGIRWTLRRSTRQSSFPSSRRHWCAALRRSMFPARCTPTRSRRAIWLLMKTRPFVWTPVFERLRSRDVLQTVGEDLPVTGTVNLEVHASGQIDNLSGGGHLTVTGRRHLRRALPQPEHRSDDSPEGRFDATHLVFLQNGGKVTGDGGYDISAESFHFKAQGTGFDLAHIQRLKNPKYPIGGLARF